MSGAEHEGPAGGGKKSGKAAPKPPRVGSSLTDAVVAALAKVDDKDGEPKAAGDAPAPAEAGCAATQQAGQSAPGPAAPPPVVASAAVGAVPSGANGFRSGPGSFADLLRRWSGGEPIAPSPAAGSPAPVAAAASAAPAGQPAAPPPAAAPAPAAESPAPESPAAAEAKDEARPSAPPPKKAEPAAVPPTQPAAEGAEVEVHYFGRTDVGLVREHNEDNFLVADLESGERDASEPRETEVGSRGCIFAVCDGMGGAAAGEVASQMAVDTIHEVMNAEAPQDRDAFARRLVRAIEEAGHRIFSAAKMDRTRRGMGTTTTLAGLVDNVLFVGQVGDSRAYVLRGGQLELITKDQSLVNQLIEAGQLTEDEAEAFEHSNIILQALGTTEDVTVDLTFLELRRGDRLLMCSDGLSGLVHAEMIKEVLEGTPDLAEAADKLIQMANAGGGHDNITVILADFAGDGLAKAEDTRVVYQQYPLPPAEGDAGKSVPPREPSIKSGGKKPGADVKRDEPVAGAAVRPAAEPAGGGSKMLLGVLAAVVLLALLVGGYFMMNGGEGEPTSGSTAAGPGTGEGAEPTSGPDTVGTPEEPTDIVEEPTEATDTVDEQPATVQVLSEVENASLFVNGQLHGPLQDGMTLELAPNPYTFEVRRGETIVVPEQALTLSAGQTMTLELQLPEGADGPTEEETTDPEPEAGAQQQQRPTARPGRTGRTRPGRRSPTPQPEVRPFGGGSSGTSSPRPRPTPSTGGGTAPPANPF